MTQLGALPLSIRILLAATFLAAGIGKLLDPGGSRRALVEFGVGRRSARIATPILPLAELAVTVLLLIDPTARYGGAGALVLLTAFTAGIARAISRGRAPDCHCFGQLHSEPAGAAALIRNLLLGLLAAAIVGAGPGPGIPGGVERLTGAQLSLAVVSAIAVLLALAVIHLWGERRRLSQRLRPTPAASGARVPARGSRAPDFALTPIRGSARGLIDLTERGHPTVLIFLSTGCGSCVDLLPELARWQTALTGSVSVAAVLSGPRAESERLVYEHGLSLALAEDDAATAALYGAHPSPSAVLVTDGAIAGGPVAGVISIEGLVRLAVRHVSAEMAPP